MKIIQVSLYLTTIRWKLVGESQQAKLHSKCTLDGINRLYHSIEFQSFSVMAI